MTPMRVVARSGAVAILFACAALAPLGACRRDGEPDAYGNFEATEVVVSAQTSGEVRRFTPVEGLRLERGSCATGAGRAALWAAFRSHCDDGRKEFDGHAHR